MGKPKQTYTLKFVERSSERECMPVIVTDHSGTRIGTTGSFNHFECKDDVNRFLNAQRHLAKHFGLANRFDEHVKGFDLIKEIAYTTKIAI